MEVQGGIVGGPTRGKEDNDAGPVPVHHRLNLAWTMAYYLILIGGAIAWWQSLWYLTESAGALAQLRTPIKATEAG